MTESQAILGDQKGMRKSKFENEVAIAADFITARRFLVQADTDNSVSTDVLGDLVCALDMDLFQSPD